MDLISWYVEYLKQRQELQRLFWQCLLLSQDNSSRDALKILCENISNYYSRLFIHWGEVFSNETFPKSEDIFRHLRFAQHHDFKNLIFDDFLEADNKALKLISENSSTRKSGLYVSEERINELALISSKFDLTRLIDICKELNLGYQAGQLYALPLLVRCILDHIPPIFGHKSFKEVVNNYSAATKSFRDVAKHLEESSRKIGDSFLHTQIRQSESRPNSVQVDFRQSLDVILSEIVRVLG